jgi:outer membrane receptor protein involved in Fe transport
MYNFETGYSETGDTNLVTAAIDNWDVRWELFPGPAEFVALGLFYKEFEDPIQKFVSETVGGYALAPQNGEQALLRGWEAEMRVSFLTLWKALDWLVDLGGPVGPPGIYPLSLVANHSRVHSEVVIQDNVDALGNPIFLEKPFTGQSKYSTNVGLYYGSRLWEGSLLYKAFGRRVDAYGTGSLPDIYEFPAESLDLALGYRLGGNTRLKLTAENLLDQETVFLQDTQVTQKWNTGTRVGFTVTFEPASGGR